MKRINKIIIFFFVLSFTTVYGGWLFIHSEKFSEELSLKVSDVLTKRMKVKLQFERVEFGIFPPSTTFKNIKIQKITPGKFDTYIELKNLGVYFTLMSFFSSNLEIDELLLSEGKVDLNIVNNPNEPDIDWQKIKIKEVNDQYIKMYSYFPVKMNLVRMEKIKARVNESSFNLNKISLMPHRKNIRLKANVSDVYWKHEYEKVKLKKISNLMLQLNLDKDDWKIDYLNLTSENTKIALSGKVFQPKNESKLEIVADVETDLKSINDYWDNDISDLKKISGKINSNIKITGGFQNLDGTVNLKGKDINSPYINLEAIDIAFRKSKNIISVAKMDAFNKLEVYHLTRFTNIFDLNKKSFLKTRGTIEMQNAFTNTFLYAVKNSLESFRGYVTGKVEVLFDGEKVYFNIYEKAKLANFQLLLPKSSKPLLQNPGFELHSTTVSIDRHSRVGIEARIQMPATMLKIGGHIDSKEINLNISDSKIDMSSFGPIGSVKLNGSGPIDLKVSGPIDDVRFDFNVQWKKFGLLDLNFGDVKSHFVLSLSDVMLSIDKLEGKFNSTAFDANGWLHFGDKSGLDVKLNFPESNFVDAKSMYALVFKKLKLPPDLNLKFSANYRVYGDFDLEKLRLDGNVKGSDLHVLGEDAEKINFDFALSSRILNFKNVKLKKSRGDLLANASISLVNNYSEVEASGRGIRLSDLNFYKNLKLAYDSDLSFEFDGNGSSETFSSRLKFTTIDPFIGNFPATTSSGLIYLNHDNLVAKLNLLGGKIKIDSTYDYNSNQVALKTFLEAQDLRELLGVLSSHNINDKTISGMIKLDLSTKFNAKTLAVSNFNLNINQFKLKRDEVDIRIDPKRSSIKVESGVVKKWDLYFTDGKDFFSSTGKNIQSGIGILAEQSFSVKSAVLELASGFIEKSKGLIMGSNQIQIGNALQFNFFKIFSNDSSIKLKNIPGIISGLNYEITKNANRFELLKLVGKYGDGEFKASGFFMFENIFPTLNIEVKMERSLIPVLKKSNLVISGNGILSGTGFPYKFVGKANLLHGEILDDLSEMTNGGQINLDEFNKYLPVKNDSSSSGYVNLNVSVDTQNYVVVKNNLAEIYLKAQGEITGSVLAPEINIRLDAQPTNSKFKFKGHDFLLSQGFIEVHDKGKTRNSDLKFVGVSRISDYEIKIDISGKLDKVGFNLSSDPVKSQEDILSLLTLGVTSEMNKNLDPNERSAITRLGIGTIFLDRLKVNDDLNSSIGVNLSVAPEFQEDETSLVSGGKSAVSESSTNRLKSATKIKLNKKLSNKVDVSVSSTVGGSIEQKQEMNINWNVNKTMSLEGVYEIKPSEDDNANTPTSLGADLKFKWSF